MQTELTCPKCNQIDKVKKVSAVVGGGTTYGSYSGISTGQAVDPIGNNSYITNNSQYVSGRSSTDISLRLLPPAKPIPQTNNWLLIIGIILLIIFIPLLLCFIPFGITYPSKNPNGNITIQYLSIFITIIICVFPIIFGVVLIILFVNKREKSKKESEKMIPIWEKALETWNKLYYCERDDIVFIPGTNESAPVINLNNLLYK